MQSCLVCDYKMGVPVGSILQYSASTLFLQNTYMNQPHSPQIDTNALSDKVSDTVKEALSISLRGCDEL
ncbi:MAG: hypothetical protein RI918_2380, partial [Pseudomonadota bacterium]